MSATKAIKNPEVPGLECLLPPPPPPPPPQNSPSTSTVTVTTTSVQPPQNVANNATPVPVTVQFPNVATPPYFVHPAIPPQTSAPWWVATEADSSDLYESQYAQWYEATPKTALPTNIAGKMKSRYFKRKSEFIDPVLDAEKVASAQQELSALMKPLKCDLCNAVMNSTLQAKLHYDGKPHQKKVSMFLNRSVKKLKSEDNGQVSSTTEADRNVYCEGDQKCRESLREKVVTDMLDLAGALPCPQINYSSKSYAATKFNDYSFQICKTWFTSQTDATQHYFGKKHLRAANGGPCVRPPKKNQYNQVDSTGRFGIGVGFQNDQTPVAQPLPEPAIVAPVVPPMEVIAPLYTAPSAQTYGAALRCNLCGISANRFDQLETHNRGARHLKMLKMNGLAMPEPVLEPEIVPGPVAPPVSVTAGPIDYSIYRTPSGQYYCAPCNVSLNSETSFAQHVESKKHKNQLNPKPPATVVTTPKKAKSKKK